MSNQSFRGFLARVQNDEGLKRELQALGSQTSNPVEDVIAFAASKGYDISADDLREELTQHELDGVVGGASGDGLAAARSVPPAPVPGDSSIINLLLAPPSRLLPSDRRLKSNITRVGTHPLGVGIYEYDIFGRRTCGVMADEVERLKPAAVRTHVLGIKMVDYAML